MAVVAIRCPTCGSAAALTANPNEYQCSHCQTRFQLVRPSDATLTTDARAHHCPLCGRPVQITQSFKCTECGRLDFCSTCVTSVPSMGTQRFVCRSCMNQKGWACSSCGEFAHSTCIVCMRRSCGTHYSQAFGLPRGQKLLYMSCPSCNGRVCVTCVETKSGFFSSKYFCKKCSSELQLSPEQARYCKFCHRVISKTGAFCTNCGKALT